MINVNTEVLSIFRRLLNNPNINIQLSMVTGDLAGWDSFKNVEIILACEEKFCIRFRSKDIDTLNCVGDLINLCETKIAQL